MFGMPMVLPPSRQSPASAAAGAGSVARASAAAKASAAARAGTGSTADAVVVGGGTIGAWCAYFLRAAGLDRVVLIEKHTLGQGASSRAAGVVRTQGGSPWAVRL